jgi:hypothetical protein
MLVVAAFMVTLAVFSVTTGNVRFLATGAAGSVTPFLIAALVRRADRRQ